MDPIFARTRWSYDSYLDFWRLVEASKFPICFVDEIDLTANRTYVFTPLNGEVLPHLQSAQGKRRARVIWWNLERPQDETLASSLAALDSYVDEIWISDRWYASRDERFRYVQLAGHLDFGTRSYERDWDVCMLAYLWGRRQNVVDELMKAGLKITPSAWGRGDQDKFVATSHLMLNLHQYEGLNTVAPLRFAVAASYAIPIISETFNDLPARDLVIADLPIESIVATVRMWLGNIERLVMEGQKLHQQLCLETDFRREVMKRL